MKYLTNARNFLVASAATLFTTSAFAAVDPAVQTAFDAGAADANTVLGYIIIASVAVIAGLWALAMTRRGKSM